MVEQRTLATQKIILEMKNLAEENGIAFHVPVLYEHNTGWYEEYRDFFKQNGINYVDCRLKPDETNVIRGDGHANDKGNNFYARCIEKYLSAVDYQ